MKDRIRQILTDHERVNEHLLALSDYIWLSIDHNDSEALRTGVEFKAEYNERLTAFAREAGALSALIQRFTAVEVDDATAPPREPHSDENQRRIRELDRSVPHTLLEKFVYKRPFGFVLQGRAYTGVSTWRRVYELVCRQLAEQDLARFTGLPRNSRFISSQGNPAFSTDPDRLRDALSIAPEIYAEANLSADSIVESIRRLLHEFGIPEAEMRIYLREDRNALNADDDDLT
jgi:hypothetical protein